MVVAQGDLWWARIPKPSGPRPIAVVQGDSFNRSEIRTTVVVPLARSIQLASAPGNVLLEAGSAGLEHDSVANVSQIFAVDRRDLRRRLGRLSPAQLAAVLSGIDLVLGR